MSNRFLVVVRAGDHSLHPQWLATGAARNWDLIVHYSGEQPRRYPESGEGMIRIDAKGPKWRSLHALLDATREAWKSYDYVWIPDETLSIACDEINRLFELVAGVELQLAQPSFSWDAPFESALTLHNAQFALRYTSFVDPAAAVFSRALLERVLPTLRESVHGIALGQVWPRFLSNPAKQCAVIDCVQARRIGAAARGAGDDAAAEAHKLMQAHGIPAPLQLVYGALGADGSLATLFDEGGDEFIRRLIEGYLGCAAAAPSLGPIYAAHANARRQFLRPVGPRPPAPAAAASQPAKAAPVAPASDRLEALRRQAPAPRDTAARAGGELVLKI
jgi:hypothetical protein